MKKIIAIVLTILCVALAGAFPGSAELTDEHFQLEALFLEYKEKLSPGLVASVSVVQFENYDDVTVFTAYCEYNDGVYDASGYTATISDSVENLAGRYLIKTSYISDNILSIFTLVNGEIMPFTEALEKGLVSIDMLDGFNGVEYIDIYGVNGDGIYESIFVERLDLHYLRMDYYEDYVYEEVYFHYKDAAGTDESEPEYAVIRANHAVGGFTHLAKYIGDWAYFDHNSYTPESVPYFIYVPAEDKIYTLSEALDAGIEDVELGLRKIKHLGVMGDADRNYILNVKDATEIQKHLSDLPSVLDETYRDELTVVLTNFTREEDGITNVKDATAIQKHIAGLEV